MPTATRWMQLAQRTWSRPVAFQFLTPHPATLPLLSCFSHPTRHPFLLPSSSSHPTRHPFLLPSRSSHPTRHPFLLPSSSSHPTQHPCLCFPVSHTPAPHTRPVPVQVIAWLGSGDAAAAESNVHREMELRFAGSADATLVVSAQEVDVLRHYLPHADVRIVSNIIVDEVGSGRGGRGNVERDRGYVWMCGRERWGCGWTRHHVRASKVWMWERGKFVIRPPPSTGGCMDDDRQGKGMGLVL
eukprot:359585-Chlamydomonas_euryale.AAC.2